MKGPTSLNGTYDQVAFSQRAVEIIHDHEKSIPLYIYLAYHNVHDACIKDRFSGGLNAPMETVDLYKTTVRDTWKVQAAMTTELDYGVSWTDWPVRGCSYKGSPESTLFTMLPVASSLMIVSVRLHRLPTSQVR